MESEFFGFIEATVRAPLVQTHAGYIGLLPLKYKGRLICPGVLYKSITFTFFILGNIF